jgi:hypothetical protein
MNFIAIRLILVEIIILVLGVLEHTGSRGAIMV